MGDTPFAATAARHSAPSTLRVIYLLSNLNYPKTNQQPTRHPPFSHRPDTLNHHFPPPRTSPLSWIGVTFKTKFISIDVSARVDFDRHLLFFRGGGGGVGAAHLRRRSSHHRQYIRAGCESIECWPREKERRTTQPEGTNKHNQIRITQISYILTKCLYVENSEVFF